jgi:hypothetical protein
LRRPSNIIHAFAIIGVLLHAAVLVGHFSTVLGAAVQRVEMGLLVSAICYGTGQSASTDGDVSSSPATGTEQGDCPICQGCMSAVAVPPAVMLPAYAPDRRTARMEVVGEVIAQRLARVRPPTRAPPAII